MATERDIQGSEADLDTRLSRALQQVDDRDLEARWAATCAEEEALRGGDPLATDIVVVRIFLQAIEAPPSPRDGLEAETLRALLAFLDEQGGAGLVMRQILCLGAVTADRLAVEEPAVALELVRRTLAVASRFLVTVGSAGLVSADSESLRDGMTGLPNRRAFDRDLHAALEAQDPFIYVLIDVDGLKDVNDDEGHAAGDELLRRLAGVLGAGLPDGQVAYRWGGDEHAVLFRGDFDDAAASAVMRAIEAEAPSFSWGLALYPSEATDEAGLLELADARMYTMKAPRKEEAARLKAERLERSGLT